MANEYKSFYLKDILSVIDHVALECMMVPVLEHRKPDGTIATLAELASYNSLIAMNNEGVRDFANRLNEALMNEGEEKDD